MTERQPFVLEKMIQARAEFPGVQLVFIDVVANSAVLAKEIASDDDAWRLPRRRFDVRSRKACREAQRKQPSADSCRFPQFPDIFGAHALQRPGCFRQLIGTAAGPECR